MGVATVPGKICVNGTFGCLFANSYKRNIVSQGADENRGVVANETVLTSKAQSV